MVLLFLAGCGALFERRFLISSETEVVVRGYRQTSVQEINGVFDRAEVFIDERVIVILIDRLFVHRDGRKTWYRFDLPEGCREILIQRDRDILFDGTIRKADADIDRDGF